MSTSSFQVSRHIENIFQVILRQFSEDFTTELTRKISSAAPQIGFAAKFYSSKKNLSNKAPARFTGSRRFLNLIGIFVLS